MPESIVYAKKIALPSSEANSIQTLQMAAAFSDLCAERNQALFFYPGLRAAQKDHRLELHLRGLGIEPSATAQWDFLPARQRGLYGLYFRLKLLGRLQSREASLYYTRDVGEAGFIAAIRGRPLLRAPGRFVFEMHEVLFKQHQAAGKDWQKAKALEQRILDATDGLVVTNPALGEEAKRFFGYQRPVLVEPNGFNERLFRPVELLTPEKPWPDGEGTVELVYLGSLKEGKGVPELVRALAFLPERFRLTILGHGTARQMDRLEKMRTETPGGAERVRLAGFVPQADLHAACSGAHIAVLPQQAQGGFFSPLKLHEALALGLPVVATPLNVFSQDAARGLVHTAPDCSPEGLAAGIAAVADSPELAGRLRSGGLAAAGHFTWRKRAERIFEFAQSLDSARQRP